jgi:hypothetical protein
MSDDSIVLFQAEAAFLELGDHVGVAGLQSNVAISALDRGKLSRAAELCYEYLEAPDRLGGGRQGADSRGGRASRSRP